MSRHLDKVEADVIELRQLAKLAGLSQELPAPPEPHSDSDAPGSI